MAMRFRGTGERTRLLLIQMILLTHLKAGFEKGSGWSAGLFADAGFPVAATVNFDATLFSNTTT